MVVSDFDDRQAGVLPASERIPVIARPFVSERAKQALDLVEKFVEEECIPADVVFEQQVGKGTHERFSSHPPILEELKAKAKELGLWNLFLPKSHEGAGFSNLEYGLMAEYLGRSITASEATNCSAPDTGNMEVLAKYGSEAQKKKWLVPLLNGDIRSAFMMTEPQVASSDATNIGFQMRRDGEDWVLNGQKWWSSGAGDIRCKIYLVMGKSDPSDPNKYNQQSVILVPADTPGITVNRMLSVIGFDHAPEGHGHVTFVNVRVPSSNMILGEGRGFEIVQGRLGPGRIHHAMRSIGSAERAIELFVARLTDPNRIVFGTPLSEQGIMLERVARSRIEIDSARLAVLNAAIKIDESNSKEARKEIAKVKVQVPSVLLDVIDRAMQAYGAAGVSQDTPLARMWASGRTMRIVDGPDEVHMVQLGRNETKKGTAFRRRIKSQDAKSALLFAKYGMVYMDDLQLNRVTTKASL